MSLSKLALAVKGFCADCDWAAKKGAYKCKAKDCQLWKWRTGFPSDSPEYQKLVMREKSKYARV